MLQKKIFSSSLYLARPPAPLSVDPEQLRASCRIDVIAVYPAHTAVSDCHNATRGDERDWKICLKHGPATSMQRVYSRWIDGGVGGLERRHYLLRGVIADWRLPSEVPDRSSLLPAGKPPRDRGLEIAVAYTRVEHAGMYDPQIRLHTYPAQLCLEENGDSVPRFGIRRKQCESKAPAVTVTDAVSIRILPAGALEQRCRLSRIERQRGRKLAAPELAWSVNHVKDGRLAGRRRR